MGASPIDTSDKSSLFGIGKGDAQIFDTSITEDAIKANRQERFAREQEQNRRRDQREKSAYSGVGDLSTIDIDPDHQREFAKLQTGFADYTLKNIDALRNGDPNATIEWQRQKSMITNLGALSKNFREQREALGRQMDANPDAYRPESIDYFKNAAHNADGSLNVKFDPTKIKKNIDLDTDTVKNIRPIVEDMAKGKSYSYTDAQGNESVIDKNNFDAKHATIMLQDRLKHKDIDEQAYYNFKNLSPEEQKQYGDYQNYYIQKQLPKLIIDQDKKVFKAAQETDKNEKADVEVATVENPMTFKAVTTLSNRKLSPEQQAVVDLPEDQVKTLTPEQKKIREEYKAGIAPGIANIPLAAKSTHIKPITIQNPVTENMRTVKGNAIPDGVGPKVAVYGETGVTPFIKSGDKKGNFIPDAEELKKQEAAGNVEWKVASIGNLTYGKGMPSKNNTNPEKHIPIVTPTRDIKSPIAKHVDLEALQKIADEKNAGKSSTSTSSGPKKVVKGEVHDGYRFLGGDTKDSKNWVKAE